MHQLDLVPISNEFPILYIYDFSIQFLLLLYFLLKQFKFIEIFFNCDIMLCFQMCDVVAFSIYEGLTSERTRLVGDQIFDRLI